MKTFNASHLVKKPAEVFAAAREGGAIIQQKRTNGEVIEEFALIPLKRMEEIGNEDFIMWESKLKP